MISRIRLVKLFENLQIRSSIPILTKFWKSPTDPIFDHRPCYKTVIIFSENFNDQRIWIQREMFRIDFRKQWNFNRKTMY